MEHGELITTYFKDDGSKAKVYRIHDDERSYYSIAYFNSKDVMIDNKDFLHKTLTDVEGEAENWTLGA